MTSPISRAYVEIIPDLRQFTSQLSTGVRGLVEDFSRASNDAARQGARVGENFNNGLNGQLREEQARFNASMRDTMGGASSEARSAGEDSGHSFGSGFKTTALAMLAGAALFSALSKGFQFAKQAIFGFNSTLQQSTIAFTTMLGSGQKAKSFLDQLQLFAKQTPFEFQGLVQNAQLLMGMGISAKSVIPDLTALGDSVASAGGNADVLNNTIMAFAQTSAKGKVDMGNLNQMLQGGVPQALKILAAHFNTTTGNMVKMISAGKVSSAEALPALVKGIEKGTKATSALGGMMDKQSHTFQGALSNISDAMTQTTAKAFRPFFDLVSNGANQLATFLGGSSFTKFATNLSNMMSGAFKTVGAWFSANKSSIVGLVQPMMDFFKAISPVHLIMQALAPLLPVLGNALKNLAEVVGSGLATMLKELTPLLQLLEQVVVQLAHIFVQNLIVALNMIKPLIPPILQAFKSLVNIVVAFIKEAIVPALPMLQQIAKLFLNVGQVILHALIPLMPTIISAFKQVLNAVKPLIPVVLTLIQNALKVLIPVLKAVMPPLVAIAGFLIKVLAGAIVIAIKIITEIIKIITSFGQSSVDAWHMVVDAFNHVVDFFQTVGRVIQRVFSSAINWLENAGKDIVHGLITGIMWFWNNVVYPWFVALPTKVVRVVGNTVRWLFDAGKNIIKGLINGIKNMFSDIVNWFKDLPGHILSALGIHSPPGWAVKAGEWIIKAVLTGLKNLGPAALHWVENWASSIMSSIAGAVSGPAGGITLLPGAAGTSAAAMQEAARRLVPASWNNDAEFGALIKLWNQESGWRWNARNPSSGAYGIPQALPASKMAEAGGDYLTNPITQMRWGINYIFNTYGDPLGAWAHEKAFNWYDKGKWEILADEVAMVHRGEMVVPADLASTIRRLAGRDTRTGTKKDPLTSEDQQFNRAVRLSKDIATSWHDAVNNVNSFTHSLSQGVSAVRSSFFTLLRAARASGLDHDKIIQLRNEQQRLVSLVGDHERAVNRVNAATQRLVDLQTKVKDIITSTRQSVMGTFDITTAGTGGTTSQGLPAALTVRGVIGSLTGSVHQMRQFSRGIRKLVREGIPMTWVNALFQQGPGAMPMVNELASATPAQLRQLRSGYSDLSNVGTDLGKFLGRRRYGDDINDQQRRVREDRRDEARFERMMHNQETHMAHAFARALAGMAIEFDGDGLARLVSRHQGRHAVKGNHR